MSRSSIETQFRDAKLSAGSCLEGTPTISVDVGPQARLLDWLRQQVHLAADQFGQTPFQRSKRKKPDAGFRVQFGREVNIAVCLGIPPGNGAEQGQMTDAGAAPLRVPAT
jgi:hypothetical protein